jgi:hypothetical protein
MDLSGSWLERWKWAGFMTIYLGRQYDRFTQRLKLVTVWKNPEQQGRKETSETGEACGSPGRVC